MLPPPRIFSRVFQGFLSSITILLREAIYLTDCCLILFIAGVNGNLVRIAFNSNCIASTVARMVVVIHFEGLSRELYLYPGLGTRLFLPRGGGPYLS